MHLYHLVLYSSVGILSGLVSEPLPYTSPHFRATKIQRCSSPLYKMMKYMHVTYQNSVLRFKSSLDHLQLFVTSRTAYARLPCPSPSPKVCSASCPLRQWCYPTISSSAAPFSSCCQSFPASGSFPMSWLFASGSQNIGASASPSVLPMRPSCRPVYLRDTFSSLTL